mmetsp:Transcript_37186/g.57114  ORF Transcript_37186/g.57114 Transcript_37186/m.57114 type:complete len:115 (-) Transcript_37186:18-362(-)
MVLHCINVAIILGNNYTCLSFQTKQNKKACLIRTMGCCFCFAQNVCNTSACVCQAKTYDILSYQERVCMVQSCHDSRRDISQIFNGYARVVLNLWNSIVPKTIPFAVMFANSNV